MNEDPVELRETFDGYLMFDFSNFHGLMAQTFEEPEDIIDGSGTNHIGFNNTVCESIHIRVTVNHLMHQVRTWRVRLKKLIVFACPCRVG
jgi:hypothetical protein